MPGNILVVEDDEEISLLLEFLLSREGYQVSLAKDGHVAQHFIEHSDPPDLVLLDVMLPYVSGAHLLEQMRTMPTWAKTKIIMLTAKSGEKGVADALSLGADDFIAKPFKPLELVARVKHQLKFKRQQ
ncbi:response regulator receiver domain-containing protein [Methylobacter tundripaludum]|uniref:Response regulator receiver domain-containing protein n=1 Tax=Methylobacter tundripaludum TaxID=173365 RepID=A0A2S6H527_9GAMM|nr:response regulator [Methylobacter tundripaludum]PPK72582.1 response regulator receiver domain-containing protein [Methylobacter tundripaludum]